MGRASLEIRSDRQRSSESVALNKIILRDIERLLIKDIMICRDEVYDEVMAGNQDIHI